MAVCQTKRHRGLAVLVRSYSVGGGAKNPAEVIGGYDGRDGGVSDKTLSRPRVARALLKKTSWVR